MTDYVSHVNFGDGLRVCAVASFLGLQIYTSHLMQYYISAFKNDLPSYEALTAISEIKSPSAHEIFGVVCEILAQMCFESTIPDPKDFFSYLEKNVKVAASWRERPYEFGPDPVPIIACNHRPWTLPSEKDTAKMLKLIAPHSVDASRFRGTRYWAKEKHRMSAATAAIQFLESVPAETRPAMRSLVLHEDYQSIAWPDCHERRISLWRTILPAASTSLYFRMNRTPEDLKRYKYDRVTPHTISRGYMGYGGVAGWIMEALGLECLGMPAGSFSLTIDGMPTPETSTEVFNVLQRDAAWQSAYEQCLDAPISQSFAPNWVDNRQNEAYIMKGFPEALQEIRRGRSLAKCNFDTGFVYNVNQIAVQGRMWKYWDWLDSWRATGHLQADIHTVAPLPSWLDLRKENLLADSSTD